MKKLIGELVAIGIIALPITLPAYASVFLHLAPPSATVTTGDTVNVEVSIGGLGNPPSVGAFDLSVGFDPAILSPTAVTFGPFLGDESLFEALTAFDFSVPGVVEFAEVSLLTPAELDALQSSGFSLATLSFVATGNGTTSFDFIGDRRIDDAFGNKLIVPEPATVFLVAVALVALWGMRCC